MPPKGLKINDAQLFIQQPGGEMTPLGSLKAIEDIELSDDDGNKAVSHMYKTMTFECELDNCVWNKRTLIKMIGFKEAFKIFLLRVRKKILDFVQKIFKGERNEKR